MKSISTLPASEREILFRNTAEKTGLTEAIIEKDFWVCWTLDYLFHESRWKEHLAFKGGTSLSKCYDLIHRFSEDIDLILDWRLVGCAKSGRTERAFRRNGAPVPVQTARSTAN